MKNVMWLAIKSGEDFAVSPYWEWPTCGGCQPTPMVDDLCYDMISGIPGIVGNAGCLAQCVGSLPNLYRLITYGLTNIYIYIIYEHQCYFMSIVKS